MTPCTSASSETRPQSSAEPGQASFPFSAIVGQPQLKTALLLCALDTSLGGVLIRGDKGSAKSTAARALAQLLPPITRVASCAFNCAPDAPGMHCEVCQQASREIVTQAAPFVTLPLGAGEDRVLGTLNLQKALQHAQQVFAPGLLAQAHRGMLYIDEVNLLPDHLVDQLLDVAAMGINRVQREGLAIEHAARFCLIGTMNLEEGDLRPQLLDRFGLMVEVLAPREKTERAEVVRRRIAYEAAPAAFAAQWQTAQQALAAQIRAAQTLLPDVLLDDDMLDLISHLCCEFEVRSLRADIVLHKAARALAALATRTRVNADDIKQAAQLVLPHRRRRKPFEQAGLDQDKLEQLIEQQQQSQQDTQKPVAGQTQGQGAESAAQADASHQPDENPNQQESGEAGSTAEQLFAASASDKVRAIRLAVPQATPDAISGKRSEMQHAAHGSVLRTSADAPGGLALAATLRQAVARHAAADDGAAFQVLPQDVQQQIKVGKQGNLILLVVDASGSMAAQRRMEAVKGAVLSLLQDAYQQRDEVAVIAFRAERAELLLEPTKNVERAEQALQHMPTGGRTPLPHALQLAWQTLQHSSGTPLLVLLSDGRANVALGDKSPTSGDAWAESLEYAGQFAAAGVASLIVDTETGYLRLGRARQLAQRFAAPCLALEELRADQLVLTIRQFLPQARSRRAE